MQGNHDKMAHTEACQTTRRNRRLKQPVADKADMLSLSAPWKKGPAHTHTF